jgi:hypothetical protein
LSFGPIAALAEPDAAATAADPDTFRKSRRENPVIATLPRYDFYPAMMRRTSAFRKQGVHRPTQSQRWRR